MHPQAPSHVDAPPAQVADDRAPLIWLSPRLRERLVFVAVAAFMVIAGGVVAAVNGAAHFANGSWLAAYLVLVGGVAQFVLGLGCLLLPEANYSTDLRRAQLVLWNVGTLAVAGGVIGNVFGVVLAGSVVTAAGLVCFAAASGPLRDPGRRRVLVYRVLIGLLVISVLIGGTLAHGNHHFG